MLATIPKGVVGGFEFTVLQRNLKEWHESPWTLFVSAKGNVRDSVLIISHITFRDCCVPIFSNNLSQNNWMCVSWLISIFAASGSNFSPFHGFPLTRWRPSEWATLKLKWWGRNKDAPTPPPPPHPVSHNRDFKLKSKWQPEVDIISLLLLWLDMGFRFVLCDKSVPSSETSSFRLLFMTSRTLLKLTSNLRRTLRW